MKKQKKQVKTIKKVVPLTQMEIREKLSTKDKLEFDRKVVASLKVKGAIISFDPGTARKKFISDIINKKVTIDSFSTFRVEATAGGLSYYQSTFKKGYDYANFKFLIVPKYTMLCFTEDLELIQKRFNLKPKYIENIGLRAEAKMKESLRGNYDINERDFKIKLDKELKDANVKV